jgi:hypothetical protein
MKYATEMGSCAMVYVPRIMKIGSGSQKLIGRLYTHTHTHTHTEHGGHIGLILFPQIEKVG